MDSQKHDYGTGSPEAWAAMERHSERLMEIQDLLERLDMAEDTNFVLLGDHSQKDVEQMICLNALFREKGWIRGAAAGSEVFASMRSPVTEALISMSGTRR